MRFHGAKYLRKVLKPTVESILHRVKAGEDFGIEASRATAASLGRVLQATNEVMLNVISKADSLSPCVIFT